MPFQFVETRDLATLQDIRELFKQPSEPSRFDLWNSVRLDNTVRGLETGVNCFAEERSSVPKPYLETGLRRTNLEIVSLPNGVFSPQSHAVLSSDNEIYAPSLDTSRPAAEMARVIASFDAIFENMDAVRDLSSAPKINKIALPICGPGFPNYGHFLYDGLCVALLLSIHRGVSNDIAFVGQELAPWQRNILKRLGLLDRYIALSEPTRFLSVLGHTMLHGHLPYPTRLLRLVFDSLSASVPDDNVGSPRSDRVFLTRGYDSKRLFANRLALETALRDIGFDVIDTASAPFEDVVRAMRAARFVVGEGGAGMANIGFCEAGAEIFEIQPNFFVDVYTKATCGIFGLKWNLYRAANSLLSAPHNAYSVDIKNVLRSIAVVVESHRSSSVPAGRRSRFT